MQNTGCSESMEQDPKSIRCQSQKHKKLLSLMSHVTAASLFDMHRRQDRRKAVGIDRVTKDDYEANLEANLLNLVERMKTFKYIPQPVRRTYIPKLNGKLRPLGIPAYEDRLVQGVMADILNQVYEPRFLDCSFGFRPGRSAHDVIRFIDKAVMFGRVNYVLEADIKGFFDNISQEWLMTFLEHDIADKNFLRYVKRFLKAGVMEGTELIDSDKGTPQGGLISPVLANVYLHYALDLWAIYRVKKLMKGQVEYVRFADDFIFLFERESEARYIMGKLRERMAKFGLELAEDKTRILPIGRFRGTKEEFDFLGFTFYNTRSRRGKYMLGIRSCAKKLKAKKQAVKAWLRSKIVTPTKMVLTSLNRKLQGHYNYYGINGNMRGLKKFENFVCVCTFRMLRRRSQKRKITWERFTVIWHQYIQRPRITKQIWA